MNKKSMERGKMANISKLVRYFFLFINLITFQFWTSLRATGGVDSISTPL